MEKFNDCDTCRYRQPHPTMQSTSICTNKESEHYGSYIDEQHPDYGNKNEKCYERGVFHD